MTNIISATGLKKVEWAENRSGETQIFQLLSIGRAGYGVPRRQTHGK